VLSRGTWQRAFGSDVDVVGRSISIDGAPVTIVGVLDASFELPQSLVGTSVDVWRPINWSGADYLTTDFNVLDVAGRTAQGASLADVQSEADALLERMATLYPADYLNRQGDVTYKPMLGLQESSVAQVRSGLGLLLGAVGLLLLVACLNVAHLFLARGLGRVQEMAVRRALGAGTGGLVRQLLVESLVVSLVGGSLGLLLAVAGLESFLSLNPGALPRGGVIALDLRVVVFAAAVSVATAVMFGLLPALRSMRGELANELKGSGRTSTSGRGTGRLRSSLVVIEVALSLVLVAEAGLLLKSFLQVQAFDAGFVAEGVWTVSLTPTGIDEPLQYVQAMNQIEQSLASLPAVRSVAYGLTLPMEFTGGGSCCWAGRGMEVDGVMHEGFRVMRHPVSRGFFETLGVELLAGSIWAESQESETPTPSVLSETLAIELFGSAQAALGKVIGSESRQWQITGVAADTRYYGLDRAPQHGLFLPMSRFPYAMPRAHMAVRV